MAATTSLEFYFSADRKQRAEPPLLFHHIAGAPGLSFRKKVAKFFHARRSGQVEVPKARVGMKSVGNWPAGFMAMFERFEADVGLQAVLSQHTAELAAVTDAPILSIIEEPALAAAIGSRGARLRTASAPHDPAALIAQHRLANPQARSLVRLKIPDRPPDEPGERRRWAGEAERIAERFMLFRPGAYAAFLAHCRNRYGIAVDGDRDKPKHVASPGGPAFAELRRSIAESDPVWFDRMLYERAN